MEKRKYSANEVIDITLAYLENFIEFYRTSLGNGYNDYFNTKYQEKLDIYRQIYDFIKLLRFKEIMI